MKFLKILKKNLRYHLVSFFFKVGEGGGEMYNMRTESLYLLTICTCMLIMMVIGNFIDVEILIRY